MESFLPTGASWSGRNNQACPGTAGSGPAWQGGARPGLARFGKVSHDKVKSPAIIAGPFYLFKGSYLMRVARFLVIIGVFVAAAFSQSAARFPQPRAQFLDSSGYPLAGGLVWTCVSGSSCPGTPQATYTTAAGTVANANPIVLDASGSADIWFTPTLLYKVVVQNSSGVTISTTDSLGDGGAAVSNSLAANLASATTGKGAALVAYLPTVTGGVGRTVQAKLAETVSVKDFGAAGDGTTNDTTAFQAALNSGAAVIDGGGKTYLVSGNLLVSSNTTLQNFALKLVGGSAIPLSGLTINGLTTAKTNIVLLNITIDGNRKSMTNFGAPSDGDKSCFRLVGSVSNVLIENVTGSFCGTDGLQLFSYTRPATDNDSDLRFHNITVRNSTFKYNRRMGMSLDSIFGVTITNVTAEYNGLDEDEIQTMYAAAPSMTDLIDWQSGTYTSHASCGVSNTPGDCAGKTASNKYYQNGIDVEGYGVGSGIHGLNIIGCRLLHNANGGLFFLDTTAIATSGWKVRQGIVIVGNVSDQGFYPFTNTPWPYAINLNGPLGQYSDVTISGNVMTGILSLFGTNAAAATGNRIDANAVGYGYALYTGASTNLEFLGNETDAKGINFYDSLGSINQELLARLPATANYSTASNYALMVGNQSTNPLAIGGGFASGTVNAINSFGGILALNPAASGKVTIATDTAYGSTPLQVAGGIAIQSNASGSLGLGQYSSGNPIAIFNAQNNDGSAPTAFAFEFAGATPAVKVSSGGFTVPAMKSTTGTRYVCVDTSGNFTSSATACSGT